MSRNTVDLTFLKLDYWVNIGSHFLFTLMPQTQGPWSRPAILFHLNLKFLNCILIRLCTCHRAFSSAKMLLKEPEMDHFMRFCVGNHIISRAIWNARVKFFQRLTNLTIWDLWKIYKCLFIPNCLRKNKIYTYIYKVKSDKRQTVCFYFALRSERAPPTRTQLVQKMTTRACWHVCRIQIKISSGKNARNSNWINSENPRLAHPRRPRGSQSRRDETRTGTGVKFSSKARRALPALLENFTPVPILVSSRLVSTDCPWVSEDETCLFQELNFFALQFDSKGESTFRWNIFFEVHVKLF